MEFLLFRPSCVMLSAHQDWAVCLAELYVYKNSKFNQCDLFPKQLNMVQYLLRGLRTITVGLKEGGQVVGSAHRQLSPCPAHSTCVCAHLCRLLLSLLLVPPNQHFGNAWKCRWRVMERCVCSRGRGGASQRRSRGFHSLCSLANAKLMPEALKSLWLLCISSFDFFF